jgi:hypothetical protein
MPNQVDRNPITRGFNLAVFAFYAAIGTFTFWVTSGKVPNVSIEGLVLTSGVDSLRYLAIVLIAALIIRAFWNRLVSDLFAVRSINYTEAIAVVLVKSLLFTSWSA